MHAGLFTVRNRLPNFLCIISYTHFTEIIFSYKFSLQSKNSNVKQFQQTKWNKINSKKINSNTVKIQVKYSQKRKDNNLEKNI